MTKVILTMAVWLTILSGPVAAQETTSAGDVRAVIEDLRDGTVDDVAATRNFVEAFEKAKQRVRKHWRLYGALEDIVFWETFRGYDLYLVAFQSARVVFRVRRNGDGEFNALRYRQIDEPLAELAC